MKREFLICSLFLAIFVIFVESLIHLFIGVTFHDFLLVFILSYGVMFLTLSLIYLLNSDEKERDKRINPFEVYFKK